MFWGQDPSLNKLSWAGVGEREVRTKKMDLALENKGSGEEETALEEIRRLDSKGRTGSWA